MEPANILKINTLGEGWTDKDNILLHACFQLLTDFVEQEMLVYDFPDWNEDEEMKEARKEIEDLYQWWQKWKNKDWLETDDSVENENLKRLINIRKHMWT